MPLSNLPRPQPQPQQQPQHPPPPQEVSVILDDRIYYLKLGHRRKDYKLSADDWFFDFLIERNPEWLVPLLQQHKGAISLQFGSHPNCMEAIVVLAEEAAAAANKKKQHQQQQRVRASAWKSSSASSTTAAAAANTTTTDTTTTSIHTSTTQSLPSFQLQVQMTVQVKKKKQHTTAAAAASSSCSGTTTTTTTTPTKQLRLWKSLSDQVAGLGIHNTGNGNGNGSNDTVKQEVSFELTMEPLGKTNSNNQGVPDPCNKVRTVLLHRNDDDYYESSASANTSDPSSSLQLQLQTMRVQPHPRLGAFKPRQVVMVWKSKQQGQQHGHGQQQPITNRAAHPQEVQAGHHDDNDDDTTTKRRHERERRLQVHHVPTRVHDAADAMACCSGEGKDAFPTMPKSEPSAPSSVDRTRTKRTITLSCDYYHFNSVVVQDDNNNNTNHNNNKDKDKNNHSVVEEGYPHLSPRELMGASWEAEEACADRRQVQRKEEEKAESLLLGPQKHSNTGLIAMDVEETAVGHLMRSRSTPAAARKSSIPSSILEEAHASSSTTSSSTTSSIISKPEQTKMQPPSKKRPRTSCSDDDDLKPPAMPQHPTDLMESSSTPSSSSTTPLIELSKISKQPLPSKKRKMPPSSSSIVVMDSYSKQQPAVPQHAAIDLTESSSDSEDPKKVPRDSSRTFPPMVVASTAVAVSSPAVAVSTEVAVSTAGMDEAAKGQVVPDKVVSTNDHNPLGAIGAVVKACSSNIYSVLTGKGTWGSKHNNSAVHVAANTPVQDSKNTSPEQDNRLSSSFSPAEEDDDEEEFEPPDVISSSRWASLESMNEQEILSESPYETSGNAEVGEPIFDKVKALLEPNEAGAWSRRKEASAEAIKLFGSSLAKSLVLASSEIANSGMLYGSEWRDGMIRGVRYGFIPKPMFLLCLQEQRFAARGNDAVLAKFIQDLGVHDTVKEGMEEWGLGSDYSSLASTKGSFVFISTKPQCQRCGVFVARAYTFMKALKLKSIDDTLMAKVRACLKLMEANVRVPKGKLRRKRKKTASVAEVPRPVKITNSPLETIDADGKPCHGVSRRVSDSTVSRNSEDTSQSSVEWITEVSISPEKIQTQMTKTPTPAAVVPMDMLDQSSDSRQYLMDATTGVIEDLVKVHGKDTALKLVKHITGGMSVSSPSKSGHAEKINEASAPSPQLPVNSAGLSQERMGSTIVNGSSRTRKSKLPQDHNDIPNSGRAVTRSTRLLESSKTNMPQIDTKEGPASKASMVQDSRHNGKGLEKEDKQRETPLGGYESPIESMCYGHEMPVEILCYKTGRVLKKFKSVEAASLALDTRKEFLKRVLRGQRNKHMKYFFRYQGSRKLPPGAAFTTSPATKDKGVLPRGAEHMDDARRNESPDSCSVPTKDAKDLPGAPKLPQDRNNDLNQQNRPIGRTIEMCGRPIEMLCVDTGNKVKQFRSIDAAASALSTRAVDIRRVLTGHRRTHHGYFFRYTRPRIVPPKILPTVLSDIINANKTKTIDATTSTPCDTGAEDSPRNTSSVDLRGSRSSGRVDDGDAKLDKRPTISSKPVEDLRDLPDEVTHAHSSSRWACITSMDVVYVSPYEASKNAEVGEPVFDKVKTLLVAVANEGGGARRQKEASEDAIKLFGPTLAKSLVLASHQIALSGILYGSEWKDGTIRGFRYGFIPRSMLLLCLQEQRFGRGDNEAVLAKVIQDLGVNGMVKEAMGEWGIESDYNNLASAPGAFVFPSLKSQCHRCEVFVARAYTFMKVLKVKSIDDSLMAKVKSCLKIMEANVRASPPQSKRKKSTPSVEFARPEKIRTYQSQPLAIGLLTKVGPVAVNNSKIGCDGVVLEAFEPPLAVSSSSAMLEVTNATIEGYLCTVPKEKAEKTKAPTRKVEKICIETGKVLESYKSAHAARVAMGDDGSSIYLALSGRHRTYKGGRWRYAGSPTQPPGRATPKASKRVGEPQKHEPLKQKQASPQVKPVPPNQLDDGVIDLTDDVDDGPLASEAEELQSFGGLRHVLFSNFGATLMADSPKEGPSFENKASLSAVATTAASGTSPGGIRHALFSKLGDGVALKPPPVAAANGVGSYLSNSDTESEATIPETKPASLLKSHNTPLLFPPSSNTDEETPWHPHDPDEIILDATEIEVAWLVEESIYGLRNRKIQWNFVWEYASPALRIQLRKIDFVHGKELEQLIRFQDVMVSKRFPIKRKLIRRELHRGELRERMRDVIPTLRLAGRRLIGLVKTEQEP